MKKKALGRGLKALIPEHSSAKLKHIIKDIPIENIFPNPHQPRLSFNNVELTELSESLKEFGIIQPIIVRSRGTKSFELIAGERRLKAAKIAGFKRVPCIVKEVKDSDSILLALIENIHRVNLNPIEEAKAYEVLMMGSRVTQQAVANKIKKSRTYVTNILRLLKLPLEIQELVVAGKLSIGQVRPLISLTETQALVLANKILKKNLSSRSVELAVKKLLSPARKSSSRKKKMVEIIDVENRLQDLFGTKVNIEYKKGSGKFQIYFYSDDDLNRILELFTKK